MCTSGSDRARFTELGEPAEKESQGVVNLAVTWQRDFLHKATQAVAAGSAEKNGRNSPNTVLFSTLVYSGLGHDGVSLSVRPNRSQFFEYESLIVSCEVQGSSAGWTLKRYTSTGKLSACGTDWGKQQGFSCIVSLIPSDSGVYWCESGSGEHSTAVNITVHDGAVILESPALPVTEGHSVTLRCRYRKDKEMNVTHSNLTADFYKDGSLVRTETTGEMTIPAVSKSDEGLYKCSNSEGESPERLMTLTVLSHPDSLSVRPNRSQFFEYESLIVSCEVQGSSAGWTPKRYTSTGKLSACGTDWGKQQAGAVILESPALPVTVGDSVTLRCRYKGTPSDLTADFYKDGSLVRTETTGEMTIPAVYLR
ncbi:Fc receptor-like protein 5, partial [Oncorhynchus nerka]|uniref:Fc receptor-like protein 5 n=1 Tax=Oncorhynchus nerka TaxID=8023 RepID=UPI0031B8AA0E